MKNMSSSNPFSEELEALKSIFDKDLKCDGSEIIITLFPLQEKEKKEIFVQVDLCIECSAAYPKKEPSLTLRNAKGLSDKQLEVLYSRLNDMAKSLIGDVMIYNLAYFVQEYLLDNNKPGKKSCYEEMLIRREQLKQEAYQSEICKKNKLLRHIKEKQKEMYESDANDSSNDENDEDLKNVNFSYAGNNTQREIFCEHRNCKYIQFNNKVLRGRCIEHDVNSILYCAMDSTTGDQLLMLEWIIKHGEKDQTTFEKIQQKLESFQKDLNNLKKLCHENLVSYIDFKWSYEKGEWVVHLLQEYDSNFSLNVLIDKCADVDISFLKYILTGILSGLEHLHSHGVIHGCLTGSHIYINQTGTVKLSGYGIKKTIDDLYVSSNSNDAKLILKNATRKSDILQLGLLLLKLMKLELVDENNIVVPDFQPPELKEFVEKCLIENEEGRWTARKLLNHKFLKVRDSRQRTRYSTSEMELKMNAEMEKPYEILFHGGENDNSRLSKEFKILNFVGNGSFGKVLKVKNKLDGNVYAIKAIRLSAKNKQLDKKMVREVKLLSKLNHENVVRYYTSWIETDSNITDQTSDVLDTDVVDGSTSAKVKTTSNLLEDNDDDDDDDDDEEDDEDEEEEESDNDTSKSNTDEVDNNAGLKSEQSSYVQFLRESGDNNETENDSLANEVDIVRKKETIPEPNRTMYIQMEFCEKSTLRIAMNETLGVKLCSDERRLWRLLREIVEGLAYVHGQGMIHRDLKPENIFLDSNDHVKIGDFGLATVSVASKCFWIQADFSSAGGDNNVSSQNMFDDLHTGRVGTSLYVAPELDKSFGKSFYNKKVDIYSLGIIFFEMCHGPFDTDMERIETLLNLRKFEIILPECWSEKLTKQRNLVKKLLNHDPKSRPSCPEILEGNYLPPAEFEYEHLQEILRQTLSNPKSKVYKYLIGSCFDQEARIEEDITYQFENVRSEKQYFLLDLVKERLENIVKKRGAIYFSAPLLQPKVKEYKSGDTKVKLMTHSGSIVNLPHDLRISFARYAAIKGLMRLRRYAVDRVYKEKKVHGLHPKEHYECAFDLVTPSRCIEIAELEVFSLIQEVINGFKPLKGRNCIIRLNHCQLLKAILIHFNSEKWYSDVFKVLSNAKDNKYFKSKLGDSLQALGVQSVNALVNLFSKEESLNNVKRELLGLFSKRGKTLNSLNVAFQKLQSIIVGAERLDINIPIRIALGVVCNSEQCSDIMFDVVYSVKQKGKKEGCVTVMSGCRYDGLIDSFRTLFELTHNYTDEDQPSAVGLTVYLDKVVAVLKEDNALSEYVVVCSFGSHPFSRLKGSIVRKLWDAGIKCYEEQTIETLEELTEYCRENKIVHIVNLKEDENMFASVMTWDNERNHYMEKRMAIREVADYIRKHSRTVEGHSSPHSARQSFDTQSGGSGGGGGGGSGGCGSGNTGRAFDVTGNGSPNVNVHFVTDEKLTSTQRRRFENSIGVQMSSIVCRFSPRTRLEILGVVLDEQKVKEIVVNFKASEPANSDGDFVTDRWADKKQISKIYSKIRSLLAANPNAVVVLYSLTHDKYQLILGQD